MHKMNLVKSVIMRMDVLYLLKDSNLTKLQNSNNNSWNGKNLPNNFLGNLNI